MRCLSSEFITVTYAQIVLETYESTSFPLIYGPNGKIVSVNYKYLSKMVNNIFTWNNTGIILTIHEYDSALNKLKMAISRKR